MKSPIRIVEIVSGTQRYHPSQLPQIAIVRWQGEADDGELYKTSFQSRYYYNTTRASLTRAWGAMLKMAEAAK